MQKLETIADRIHESFQTRTERRDQVLTQARTLIRHCAQTIRAVHRDDWKLAEKRLAEAAGLAESLRQVSTDFPDLYYAGYTQDALKEYTEASVVYAILQGDELPEPEQLGVEYATYLKGLAESAGEFRRRCLDILRDGYSEQAEQLLARMDDIYGILVTMDYPDAITNGLRRLTDMVRGVNERTRGDVTVSLREQQLAQSMRDLEARLRDNNV